MVDRPRRDRFDLLPSTIVNKLYSINNNDIVPFVLHVFNWKKKNRKIRYMINRIVFEICRVLHSAVQSQNYAVTAYFSSKQTLSFGFAEQCCMLP